MSTIYEDIENSRTKSPPGTFHIVSGPRRSGKTRTIVQACTYLKTKTPATRIAVIGINDQSNIKSLGEFVHKEENLKEVEVMSCGEFCERLMQPGSIQLDYAFFNEFAYQNLRFTVKSDYYQPVLDQFITKTTIWGGLYAQS